MSNFISATKLQEYSYSLYIVLQIVVNTFYINSCAFLCQRFEISLEKKCYEFDPLLVRFLALVTTMVTKVDHGNYGWLPMLVTMVSYLGYQGANYGY